MAAPALKLLLLDKTDKLGAGLAAIREHQSDLIDLDGWEDAMSYATCTSNISIAVHNNKTYDVVKSYLDVDNNQVVMIGKEAIEPYDIWPVPPKMPEPW